MQDFERIACEVAGIIDDKKGYDIKVLDLKGLGSISDYFVIATGGNARHTSALAKHVEDELAKEKGLFVHHKEGHREGDWVVLDYVDFIVHIFDEKKREYYDLDGVWSEAKIIKEL